MIWECRWDTQVKAEIDRYRAAAQENKDGAAWLCSIVAPKPDASHVVLGGTLFSGKVDPTLINPSLLRIVTVGGEHRLGLINMGSIMYLVVHKIWRYPSGFPLPSSKSLSGCKLAANAFCGGRDSALLFRRSDAGHPDVQMSPLLGRAPQKHLLPRGNIRSTSGTKET